MKYISHNLKLDIIIRRRNRNQLGKTIVFEGLELRKEKKRKTAENEKRRK
jgi:hypothetical protein